MSQVALRTTTIFHRSALHRIALMFGDQKRYPTLKLQTSPEPQVLHFNLEVRPPSPTIAPADTVLCQPRGPCNEQVNRFARENR